MTDREQLYRTMTDETMDEILAEASDPMSPTLTPFVTLGTSDPGEELMDGPTTPAQARAHDLWEVLTSSHD